MSLTNPLEDLLPDNQPQGLGGSTAGAPAAPGSDNAPGSEAPRAVGLGGQFAGQTGATDVGTIASEYASQDSPLMQRAATAGKQYANDRGLLNSSMAAQASQNAVLDRVIPLAQQEAAQRFQGEMSAQGFGQAQELSNQEYRQSFDLQQQQLFTERDLAQLDADTRVQLLDMESGLRERLAQLDIDAEDRSNMMSMVTSFNEQYQEAFRTIMGNPDIAAADRNRLLTSAGDLLLKQTDMLEGLYNYDINWSGGTIDLSDNSTSGTSTPGTGTAASGGSARANPTDGGGDGGDNGNQAPSGSDSGGKKK